MLHTYKKYISHCFKFKRSMSNHVYLQHSIMSAFTPVLNNCVSTIQTSVLNFSKEYIYPCLKDFFQSLKSSDKDIQ